LVALDEDLEAAWIALPVRPLARLAQV